MIIFYKKICNSAQYAPDGKSRAIYTLITRNAQLESTVNEVNLTPLFQKCSVGIRIGMVISNSPISIVTAEVRVSEVSHLMNFIQDT